MAAFKGSLVDRDEIEEDILSIVGKDGYARYTSFADNFETDGVRVLDLKENISIINGLKDSYPELQIWSRVSERIQEATAESSSLLQSLGDRLCL